MTDVTRIACPGCRTPLRFEPEALDFPGNCAACECRFSVGIYIRVACPKCHCGSKIRESYRGQRVRCVRCQHDFVADDGILPGGGGLLLVARMLDTGLVEPPETIQPFVGHARSEMTRRQVLPTDERVLESERLRVEAMAERDRLAQEAGLFKAILARLVSNTPEGTPEGPPQLTSLMGGSSDRIPVPIQEEGAIARLTEERDRFESLAEQRKVDLDELRQGVKAAEERSKEQEERLDQAVRAFKETEQENSRLADEHARAFEAEHRERTTLSAQVDRLNRAVRSTMAGEAEALRRLGEMADGIAENDPRLEIELEFERERHRKLTQVVDDLKAEIEAARKAEADRAAELEKASHGLEQERRGLRSEFDQARLEAEASHRTEQQRLSALLAEGEQGRLALASEVERLKAELDAEADRSHSKTQGFEQERQGLLGHFDKTRLDIDANHRAEQERLAALLAEREQSRLALAAELDRHKAELAAEADRATSLHSKTLGFEDERKGLLDHFDRTRLEAETNHRAEQERLAALLAEGEHNRLILAAEVDCLKAELQAEADRAAGLHSKTQGFEEERKGLLGHFDQARLEIESNHRAEQERLAALLAEGEHNRLALAGQIERLQSELAAEGNRAATLHSKTQSLEDERLGLLGHFDETRLEVEATHQTEKERLAALLARGEEGRQALSAEVDRLKAELEAEAKRSAGLHSKTKEFEDERQGLLGHFDKTRVEIESSHQAEQERLSDLLAEGEQSRLALAAEVVRLNNELQAEADRAAGLHSKTEGFEEERKGLLGQFDKTRLEIEASHHAEQERLAALLAEGEHSRLALAGEVDRLKAELDAEADRAAGLHSKTQGFEEERKGLLGQFDQTRLEIEASHRVEQERLAALLAEGEHNRLALAGEVDRLKAELQAEADLSHSKTQGFEREREGLLGHFDQTRLEAEAGHKAEQGHLASLLAEAEQSRLAVAGEVERLKAELQAEADRAAGLHSKTQGFEEERQGLLGHFDKTRLELESGHKAEQERLTALLAEKDQGHLALTGEVERLKAELAAGADRAVGLNSSSQGFEEERLALLNRIDRVRLEVDASHRAEQARLTALLAEGEQGRLSLYTEVDRLKADLKAEANRSAELHSKSQGFEEERRGLLGQIDRMRLETDSSQREGQDRLEEAVDRLLEENRVLNEEVDQLKDDNYRISAEMLEASRASSSVTQVSEVDVADSLRLEKERHETELEHVKSESERFQKALVTDIQRVKQLYENLANTNKALEDKLRQLQPGRPNAENPSRTSDGTPGGKPGASKSFSQSGDDHRDLAVTMLYGDDK